MNPSKVIDKIRNNQPVFSMKSCYADPELVEFLGQTGVDCLWICLEHRQLSPNLTDAIIRSCRINGVDPFFRVKPSNHTDLLYLLENGVKGIMVPQVRGPEEVEEIVQAMRFPPIGQRGLDTIHADSDFGTVPLTDYMKFANENTFLAIQVETVEILDHLDRIASMDGVDMLFIGPGDLSANLGVPGQLDHQDVRDAMQRTVAACSAHGKTCAVPCSPDQVHDYYKMGIRFFNIASDFRYIRSGVNETKRQLEAFADSLPE